MLLKLQLHAQVQKLESTTEKLREVSNLEIDHLLVIDVVVRLEIQSCIRHVQDTVYLN